MNRLKMGDPMPPRERPGDRIGRYKLLEQIGEGGCGVVYVAEQEEPVRRRVALKVIKLGMDTVVVGAYVEASNARGVNGNQANNSAQFAGAAYVFVRTGTNWTQQAYLKASNTGPDDLFGSYVAISGNTVVVGALGEASNSTGVNGNQTDNSAFASGATYVFVRNGTNWSQQAYLKASNTGPEDFFGSSVTISGDTVVVGAGGEDSNATGVNGDQSNNSIPSAGAAYVFTGLGPQSPPELRLTAKANEGVLQLTATGTTNTHWRLESCNALTVTNAWQPLTNITLSTSPTVIQQPITSTNRFYRGAWVP